MKDCTLSERLYGDIMYMPHHRSETRIPMSRHSRSAQFAPFAALDGHIEAVRESARLTDRRLEPDEDAVCDINGKLFRLCSEGGLPEISVEYFIPDSRKAGGRYVTLTGKFRRIDEYLRRVIMLDGAEVPIDDIYRIDFISEKIAPAY